MIIPVYCYLANMKSQKRLVYSILAIIVLLIVAYSYYYFLAWIGSFGILAEAYAERYSESGEGSHDIDMRFGILSLAQIVLQVFLIYGYREEKKENSKVKYLSTVFLITIIIFEQMNVYNVNLGRMALYFYQIYFVYLSIAFKNLNASLRFAKLLLLIIMLKFCIDSSFDHTYEPKDYTYSSKILGV